MRIHAARHPPSRRRRDSGARPTGRPHSTRSPWRRWRTGSGWVVGPGEARPLRRRRHLEEGGGRRSRPRPPRTGSIRKRGSEGRLDTSRYTDLARRRRDGGAAVDGGRSAAPFVVVAELRAGFAFGKRSADTSGCCAASAEGRRLILYADDQTTHHYASTYRQLRAQGAPIPTNDLWIAALVLQHNLSLHDRDVTSITCPRSSASDARVPRHPSSNLEWRQEEGTSAD